MEEIIEKGIAAILARINLSTGFTDPTDKGCTIEMLKKLHQAGYYLELNEICDYAIKHGLPISYKDDLKKIIEGINANKMFRLQDAPYWKKDIVNILRNK